MAIVRKFDIPVQLPADPTAPLQAATKQYRDSYTTYAPTPPAGPVVGQRWVNTDTGNEYMWSATEWFQIPSPVATTGVNLALMWVYG